MATGNHVIHADKIKLSVNQVLILRSVEELNADPYSFQSPTYENIRKAVIAAKGNTSRFPNLRSIFEECVNLNLIELCQQSALCNQGLQDTYALTESGQTVLTKSTMQTTPLRRALA